MESSPIQNFIECICSQLADQDGQFQAGQNKAREFIEALRGNGIHYLLIHYNTCKMMVDDLHGKRIGFIICDFKLFDHIKLQQIYKDLQEEDPNFIMIWVPAAWPECYGHGTYTRLIQRMPWATFPHPHLVNVERRDPCFVVLDEDGQIANQDAWGLLLAWGAWGVKPFPFTQHTTPENFLMKYESCLEFLLHGMTVVVGRKPMKNKRAFLYAHPGEWHDMWDLEELTAIHDKFEGLCLGKIYAQDIHDIDVVKQDYEEAIQYIDWPLLSFSDMIMFWYRCKYCVCKLFENLNIMMETEDLSIKTNKVRRLANQLYSNDITSLVLLDNDGAVTCVGYDVLQMICESPDEVSEEEGMTMAVVKDELMKSLSRGECSPIVKTFFKDEIDDVPQHPEHRNISLYPRGGTDVLYTCGVCFCKRWATDNRQRLYKCNECDWFMCGRCWMKYAKKQVETLRCKDKKRKRNDDEFQYITCNDDEFQYITCKKR